MARSLKNKELINTRLATNYGGWMYCEQCQTNIGYLCYATYDQLVLKYQCKCGSHGSVTLDFIDSQKGKECRERLTIVKNRFCCPADQSPLITILANKVSNYELKVTCKACHHLYTQVK